MLKFIARFIQHAGIDVKKLFNVLRGLPFFIRDYFIIRSQIRFSDRQFEIRQLYPILDERFIQSSRIGWNYFYQDLHVAQRIFLANPAKHVDVGSRVDGFVAHVATFRPIEVYDIRAMENRILNVTFVQADVCSPDFPFTGYCDSISSLHVIEHIGLGRYGDPIDINGHLKALANIHRALKPAGIFYFSVPIGPQRIEFNGHRVFGLQYLRDLLICDYEILFFSYVDDTNCFHRHVELNQDLIAANAGCTYGCGIFELRKKG